MMIFAPAAGTGETRAGALRSRNSSLDNVVFGCERPIVVTRNLGIGTMKLCNNHLERVCGAGSAAIGVLLVTATSSFAGVPAPAPLIGLTGPYGILAAGAAFGGFLLYKKLRNRG